MRLFSSLMCLLALTGLCLLPPAAAQETNRVVAVVGDDIITSLELERMVKAMQAQMAASGARRLDITPQQLRRVALERLIEDKLFAQEVKRLGIKVSPQELEAFIQRIKKANRIDERTFLAQLSRQGLTPEEYRRQLKHDLLKQKLLNRQVKSQVVISDEQVEEFYKKHLDQFRQMDQVRLRAIFLKVPPEASAATEEAIRQKAEKLRAEAVAKGNFAELARKYSQGPGAADGGELGPVASRDLMPQMRQALGALKPGQISPVLKIPGAYVFIQLLERSGESTIPLAQVKEQIRQHLEKQALERRYRKWMKELRDRTFVKIMD